MVLEDRMTEAEPLGNVRFEPNWPLKSYFAYSLFAIAGLLRAKYRKNLVLSLAGERASGFHSLQLTIVESMHMNS